MATKELTASAKLAQLYQLQLIDSKIDEIEILKGELPMEVSDLEDEIAGLQKRISRFDENISEIESEVSKHDANIKESEALIAKYEKQLDNVKNNREYDALTKEIELQKLEIQLSQKKIKDADKVKETKQETLNIAKEKLEKKEADLEIKQVELEKIIKKTDKEEAKLNKQSKTSQKDIEERLLKAYHKVRNTYRNGLAVVTVQRNSCGGCFNKIPPQLQIEISQSKRIVACEHCGRVLIDEGTANSVEQKMK